MKSSTTWIEGALLVLIAYFGFNQVYFGGDEALKWITAEQRFWLLYGIGACATVFAAIKTFRSTTFGRHVDEVQKQEKQDRETEFLKKQDITKP